LRQSRCRAISTVLARVTMAAALVVIALALIARWRRDAERQAPASSQ